MEEKNKDGKKKRLTYYRNGYIITVKVKGGEGLKVVSIKVPDEFHRQMKLIAVKQGKSIKEYVMELIEKDFQKEKE